MKSKNLAVVWSRPDSSRLAPKQVSVRLPVHVLARVRALEEMYPTRTRTEIVGDLLSAALDEMEDGLPMFKDKCVGPLDSGSDEMYYEVCGPARQFRQLTNRHYKELEAELGNADAQPLLAENFVASESDFKAQK